MDRATPGDVLTTHLTQHPTRRVLRPREISDLDRQAIAHLLPDPDPPLAAPPTGTGCPGRVLHVASTLLDGNELRYLRECVESNWVSSGGEFVERFERAFSSAVGCEHGVACANGTTALHLALATLGIGPGDEVVIPTFTMIAVANAVRYTGATPVFAEIDPETGNLDPADAAARITERTRALIVVHTYGHPAEMDAFAELARRNDLWLIEDAAEAHGAEFRGRPVGSLSDLATFSFYGNKILSTGEGGMITTRRADLAETARRLRDHAFSTTRHFWHEYVGFNYRMTNLQAALGLAQTERLGVLVERRRAGARLYDAGLEGVPGLITPVEREGCRSVFWMYGMRVQAEFGISRDELRRRLAARAIETRTFFIPLHLQPIYRDADAPYPRFPIAERWGSEGLYLPSGPDLEPSDIAWIAAQVREAASRPDTSRSPP